MFIKAFLVVLVTFLVVDALWIGLVAKNIYEKELGDLMRATPGMVSAGVFYLAYAAGIVHLAIQPAVDGGSMKVALLNGAILGGLAYGTFTVTNFAILQRWSVTLVVSDILWGIAITALCAFAGYMAVRT